MMDTLFGGLDGCFHGFDGQLETTVFGLETFFGIVASDCFYAC